MKPAGVSAAMVLVALIAFSFAATAQDTALYSFNPKKVGDGAFPAAGVLMDVRGSLNGTTQYGGGSGCINGPGCGTVLTSRSLAASR